MSKWEQHDNRVKYVEFVESVMCLPTNLTVYATPTESWSRTIYICLDGMFHSWAVPYEHNENIWEIRTVVEPNFSFTYIDMCNWFDKISKEPVGSS